MMCNVLVSNVNSCKWAEPLVLADLRQVLQEHPQLAQLLLDALQLRLQLPILLLQLRQAGGLLCTRPSCRFPVIGLPAGNRSVIIMEVLSEKHAVSTLPWVILWCASFTAWC